MNFDLDFLFLGKGELTFLLNSLKTIVEEEGFNVDKCDVNMKVLGQYSPLPAVFVADAEVLNDNADARVYVYDTCIEQNKKVVLIGEENELDKLLAITSTNIIAKVFHRPINNKDAANELGEIIYAIRAKSKQKKILVVDDSPVFLRLISEWLQDDYSVSICPSATTAFHIIETNKPDLILLDYEMPVCNGAQFLEMLHSEEATASIPVIFLTSRDDKETVSEVIALKPQGYLLKSQKKELVLNSIKQFFMKEKGN